MTERSWLWEGTTTGDATVAPYTRLRFNRWFSGPYSNSDTTKAHVIPGYLDSLLVRALSGTLNVLTVKTGAAIVGDYLYINDSPTYLTIPSNTLSTTKRVDIVALRIDNTPGSPNQNTVRIVHIKGYETLYTDTTLVPVLARDEAGYWEVEIARIFVDSDNYVLGQKHISSQVGYINLFDQFSPAENLVINPEFLVQEYDSGTTEYLGSWIWTGGGTIAPAAGIGTATRARCASVTNAALTDTLSQNVAFKRADKLGKHYFTLDGLVQPQQNNGKVIIRVNALSDTQVTYQTELTQDVGAFGEPTPTTKRVLEVIDFDDTDANNPLVSLNIEVINGGVATDDYKVGPIQLSRGFFSGGLHNQHQIVFLEKMLLDGAWDYDPPKSSGTTTIDLQVSFGAVTPFYIKGIVIKIQASDTGSAGSANCGVDIHSYDGVTSTKHGGLDLSGETNNRIRCTQLVVPIMDYWKNGNITNTRFQIVVRATGALTLATAIEIVGLIV